MEKEKPAAGNCGRRLRRIPLRAWTEKHSDDSGTKINGRAANRVWGCTGSGAVTPCSTISGAATGWAFAARTLLPKPAGGPYQAILASIAKRNASRQRPRARGARRRNSETANDRDKAPDIAAVYHPAAIERLLQHPAAISDFTRGMPDAQCA